MSPRSHTVLNLFLLTCCVLAGLLWWRLHAQQREALLELTRIQEENSARAARLEQLPTVASETLAANAPAQLQSPTEQRRRRVAELVARLKAARTARTGKPIPSSPNQSYGSIFPELLDDPQYARFAMLVLRRPNSGDELFRFQWAGVPPEKQEKMQELMGELHLTGNELALRAAKAGLSEQEAWRLQTLNRQELEAEIEALLGEETYQRLEKARQGNGALDMIRALESRLSYATDPLSEAQKGKLFEALLTTRVHHQLSAEQAIQLIEAGGPVLNPAQREAFEEIVAEFNLGKWSSGPTIRQQAAPPR